MYGVDDAAGLAKVADSIGHARQRRSGPLLGECESDHDDTVAREHHQVAGTSRRTALPRASFIPLALQQQEGDVARHAFAAGQIERRQTTSKGLGQRCEIKKRVVADAVKRRRLGGRSIHGAVKNLAAH